MSLKKPATLLLIGLFLASCTSSQETNRQTAAVQTTNARAALIGALDRCEQTHGYHRDALAGISENALAPNELAWRQCAYAALRAYQNPDPEVRRQIESLVIEDTSMTAAIQQGTMTRSQRKARVTEKIEEIKKLEEAQVRTEASEKERRDTQVRQVVEGLRSFSY